MSQWVPHKGRRVVPILQDWVATAEWHAAHSRWSRLGSCFAFLGFKQKNPIFWCFVLIFWCFFGFRSFFCFDLLMSWVFWVQIFKKTQDSLQHQPGVTDILLVTKVAVAWPKGFWYGVFFTITTRTRDTIPETLRPAPAPYSIRVSVKLSPMAQNWCGSCFRRWSPEDVPSRYEAHGICTLVVF